MSTQDESSDNSSDGGQKDDAETARTGTIVEKAADIERIEIFMKDRPAGRSGKVCWAREKGWVNESQMGECRKAEDSWDFFVNCNAANFNNLSEFVLLPPRAGIVSEASLRSTIPNGLTRTPYDIP